MTRQHQVDDTLPPLPSPDATDAERGEAIMARLVARVGAPSLEDYRRAYTRVRRAVAWRRRDQRRHPVAADPAA